MKKTERHKRSLEKMVYIIYVHPHLTSLTVFNMVQKLQLRLW